LRESFCRRGLLLPFLHDSPNSKEKEVTIGEQSLEVRTIWILEGKHEGGDGTSRVRGGRADPRGAEGDREGGVSRVKGNKGLVTFIWGRGTR
jgi:hypothetical protein